MSSSNKITIGLILALTAVWLSHFLQVFVPETGFDALWYHLPVVEAIVKQGGLVYLPNLYQSVNPLLADLVFAIGFFFARDLGAKVVAFIFGLLLAGVSFKVSRLFLSKNWSLLLLILVSTFQVVAWQSASFYIDVAKAFFELASIFYLLKYQKTQTQHHLIFSALFFSASLASKLFSLFLLPVYLILVFWLSNKNKIGNVVKYLVISLLMPLPFYLFAYLKTGQPFYSLTVHANKLEEIGGFAGKMTYLRERLRYLPISLFNLTLTKDYTSIIYLVFLPLMYMRKKLLTHPKLFPLFFFGIAQYWLWWFLPPTSTRYALSGFIILAILYFIIFAHTVRHNRNFLLPIIFSIILAIMINFAPRLLVNWRSLKYITGQQTKTQYLEQFYDGSIDRNIKEWHFRATL